MLFLTQIDGLGSLALSNIRRTISFAVALILGMGLEGRPGLRLGLALDFWTHSGQVPTVERSATATQKHILLVAARPVGERHSIDC